MSEAKREDEPTMEEILASIRKIISEDDPEEAEGAEAAPEVDAVPELEEPVGGDDDVEGELEPMELTQMVSEDGSVVDLSGQLQDADFEEPAEEEPEVPVEDNVEELAKDIAEDAETEAAEPLVPEDAPVHADLVEQQAEAEAEEPAPEEEAGEPTPMTGSVLEVVPNPDLEIVGESEAQEDTPAPAAALEGLVSHDSAAMATAAMARLNDSLTAEKAGPAGGVADKTLEALVRETMAPHLKAWLDANLPGLVERIVRDEIQKMVKRAEYR